MKKTLKIISKVLMALITLLWTGFLVYYTVNVSGDWISRIPVFIALIGLFASGMLLLSLCLLSGKHGNEKRPLKKAGLVLATVANLMVYSLFILAYILGAVDNFELYFVTVIFAVPIILVAYIVVLVFSLIRHKET